MGQLAGIFFQMGAADANVLGISVALFRRDFNIDVAIDRQRSVVLADLITFGQIGIEVALTGELVNRWDFAVERQPNHNAEENSLLVNNGQRTGQPQSNGVNDGVWSPS